MAVIFNASSAGYYIEIKKISQYQLITYYVLYAKTAGDITMKKNTNFLSSKFTEEDRYYI